MRKSRTATSQQPDMMIIAIVLIAVIIAFVAFKVFWGGNNEGDNTPAVEDDRNRYLIVVNDTGETINKVTFTAGDGIEIPEIGKGNIDVESFSVKIPSAYSDYTTFTVTLTDNYEYEYSKKVTGVGLGETTVKITEADRIGEKSLGDKLIEWFNK